MNDKGIKKPGTSRVTRSSNLGVNTASGTADKSKAKGYALHDEGDTSEPEHVASHEAEKSSAKHVQPQELVNISESSLDQAIDETQYPQGTMTTTTFMRLTEQNRATIPSGLIEPPDARERFRRRTLSGRKTHNVTTCSKQRFVLLQTQFLK